MKKIRLNNGVEIPQIGYGVYQIPKEITKQCVLKAFEVGYRHIDTAFAYDNEKEVGEAFKESGLKREEVFITTKVYGAKNFDDACQKIELSLKTLGFDYIDLMLIHWPQDDNIALYKAMEKYYKEGILKAIGLSNFYNEELDKILNIAEIPPMLNQIETHVFKAQIENEKVLKKHNIVLEAWSPLAASHFDIFTNPILAKVASKHQKTIAQVALRYLYQRDIVIIPKSKNPDRIKENFDIEDFVLNNDDIKEIETLNIEKSIHQ